MAFSCSFDPTRRLCTVTLDGRIDVTEFVGAIRTLYEHDDWRPGCCALWDGTGITRLILSPEDLEAIEQTYRDVEPRMGVGRAAFVMPRDVAQMIARLLMRRLSNPERERQLFLQIDAALAWLSETCNFDADAA